MHRSYQPILPTHNKLLQQKWDTTYYNEHIKKVKDARPIVDTKAPATYVHLHLKLKKLQQEEERLATIERDNRILLEKMSYIMRTQGLVDNRNTYEYRSLNREKRQRELLRVTRENQEILKRINMRQPEYSVQRWADDWDENQRFMDSISAFPKDWWVEKEDKRTKSRQKSARDEKDSARKEDDDKEKQQKDDDEQTREQEGQTNVDEKKEEEQKKNKEAEEKELRKKEGQKEKRKDAGKQRRKEEENSKKEDGRG